jgi:glycosyltransferase involved in cell wall biosynthesis
VRILFLNPTGILGGAERSLLDLMASLRLAEPRAELHLAGPVEGPLEAAADRLGVRVTLLPMPAGLGRLGDSGLRGPARGRAVLALLRTALPALWGGWDYLGRVRRLVASLRPDVVHSNGMKFHVLSALAAPRAGPPAIVWHLRDFIGSRRLMSVLLRQTAGRAAGAIAISRAVADDAQALLPELPVAVVHNAIDGATFAPGPGDGAWLDRLAGLVPAPPGVVRIGLVATFARWKGQDVFLEAAARLTPSLANQPLRFYVVGGPLYQTHGSQWSADELRARGAGLRERGALGFVPFQEDAAPVYRALDIVVHASTQPEPFGRTIVEAMACGRPVVISRAGGAAELFTQDHDAVGVPPGDAGALAAAVTSLVSSPTRRERLGFAAHATAVERFRRERLGPQMLEAYRRFGATVPVSSLASQESAACLR